MRVMSSAADIAHIEDCLDWLPLMSPDDATSKLIYLAIRSFESKGRCVREWVDARNQFAILYPHSQACKHALPCSGTVQ